MKFGLRYFPTDYGMAPHEVARAAEERGLESVFFAEHTHIPASRRTPAAGDGTLPTEYAHALDPFVALSAAAAATTRLGLGTGICLVIERDPIVLAKVVASLDHLSGGRVLFGVGAGWNREEMENHGTDFTRRWKVLRERIEAMKAIWTQEEATYHGEFVNFDAIWSWPKPARKPHPPVIVGGNGPGTLRRVLRYGDEWMPSTTRGIDYDAFAARIRELQAQAAEAGRGPIPVSLFGAPADEARIRQLEDMGVSRVLINLPPEPTEKALPNLDRIADLARRVG